MERWIDRDIGYCTITDGAGRGKIDACLEEYFHKTCFQSQSSQAEYGFGRDCFAFVSAGSLEVAHRRIAIHTAETWFGGAPRCLTTELP